VSSNWICLGNLASNYLIIVVLILCFYFTFQNFRNNSLNILYIWSLDRWSHNLVCVCFKVSFNLISSERKGKNVFTWLAFCSNRLPKPHFHFADCFSHNLLSTFGLESCRMMQDVEFFFVRPRLLLLLLSNNLQLQHAHMIRKTRNYLIYFSWQTSCKNNPDHVIFIKFHVKCLF